MAQHQTNDKRNINFRTYNELIEHMRGVYYTRYNIQLDDETLRLIIRINELERTVVDKIERISADDIIHYANINELIKSGSESNIDILSKIGDKINRLEQDNAKNNRLLKIIATLIAVVLLFSIIQFF